MLVHAAGRVPAAAARAVEVLKDKSTWILGLLGVLMVVTWVFWVSSLGEICGRFQRLQKRMLQLSSPYDPFPDEMTRIQNFVDTVLAIAFVRYPRPVTIRATKRVIRWADSHVDIIPDWLYTKRKTNAVTTLYGKSR